MSKEGKFLAYCIEKYRFTKGLSGKQASELFTRYDVWNYIYTCYEALHTTGDLYIIQDIDLYIEARQKDQSDH